MTSVELAELLGVGAGTVRDWRYKGTGPGYERVGLQVRYDPDVVERWLAERSVMPQREAEGARSALIFDRARSVVIPVSDQGLLGPPPSAVLKVPEGKPYGDAFYADVANVYKLLVRFPASPAPLIATDNCVPVTTAHRWIREARRRGFLAAGKPGRPG